MDGRYDREKRDRHRDLGFTICRACSACHARARLARAQPPADLASLFLARAQPLLPLPPASQSRQPSRCRACVDATDANSAAHSPGNSRASSIRRRHLTPRAGQRHQPLTARPNRPSLAPSPPAPPIKSHLSSSANAAAAPRQRPGRLADLQPAMPPPPHPLGSTSSTRRLEPGGHVGLDGTIVSRQRRQLRLPGTDLATELDGLSFFLPNHQSSSLPPHPLPFSGPILWMFRPSSLPPPTHPSSVGPAPAKPTCIAPVYHLQLCHET